MTPTIQRLLVNERMRTLLVSVGVALFMLLIIVTFDQIGVDVMKGTQDVQSFAKGFDIRQTNVPNIAFANLIGVVLIHPLYMAMLGSIALGLGARSCAGELRDGTLELSLARPLSRRKFLGAYMVVINLLLALLALITVVSIPLFDAMIGAPGTIGSRGLIDTAVCVLALYSSLGALATLISTVAPSRGAATTLAITMLVGTYFLEFFARMWSDIEVLGYLSPFHYFVPTDILLGEGLPWGDLAVLIGISVVANVLALVRFERRDLAS